MTDSDRATVSEISQHMAEAVISIDSDGRTQRENEPREARATAR